MQGLQGGMDCIQTLIHKYIDRCVLHIRTSRTGQELAIVGGMDPAHDKHSYIDRDQRVTACKTQDAWPRCPVSHRIQEW